MNRKYVGTLLVAIVLLCSSCTSSTQESSTPLEGASMNGTLTETEAGDDFPFIVQVAQTNDPIGIDFRGTLISGSVRVQLLDQSGAVTWEETIDTPGPFAVNTVVEPTAAGEYKLGWAWDGAMQIQYSLAWKPGKVEVPTVTPVALMGGIGMMLVAISFVIYAAVHKLGWGYLGLGALAWTVAVALKFAWAIPINTPLLEALTGTLPEAAAMPIFYVYVGALTGVFEVGIVWLVMRYSRLGKVDWKRALSFGIGFGAFEALLLGILSLVGVLALMLLPSAVPLASLESAARANDPLYGLAPIVERLGTIFVHIFSNALIFYAVAKRKPGWFWLAFAYKTAVDTAAAFAQFWGLEELWKIWTIEAVIVIFGLIGWLGIRWLRDRYPAQAAAGSPETEPITASTDAG
ncbi:MAG: YhfC family intramembrane metalloprotease [Anaerolineae bacterium]|nr:YhfC family intramembrane metalloprotease [Anaerolineae bacterium]